MSSAPPAADTGAGEGYAQSRVVPFPFDPQKRARSPRLRSTIADLVRNMEALEASARLRRRARRDADRRRFHLAAEAIACNLALAVMVAPGRPIALPRANGVMWGAGRYANEVYGQGYLDALDLMSRPELPLVRGTTRGFKYAGSAGKLSTVDLDATAVRDALLRHPLTWGDFEREPHSEPVVLRDDAKQDVEYRDTESTRRLKREVHLLNAHLARAPFWLLGQDGGDAIGDDKEGRPIDPTRRTVRQIFNGSWFRGGRLWGGYWETMRREDRFRLLRIATPREPTGERVVNVDYSALFPRLTYIKAGLPPPDEDPYDISGDGSGRAGWKVLINARLFGTAPLGNWPEEAKAALPGTTLRAALQRISDRHPAIAHLFENGLGFNLMRREAAMLMHAIANLNSQGITALPLHDSVIVARSEAAAAEAAMDEAHLFFTSFRAKLTVDQGP